MRASPPGGQHREFLGRYERAWARPNVEELRHLWQPDSSMQHPDLDTPVSGTDAIVRYISKFLAAAPDLRVRPISAASNGDVLFVEFEATATVLGTAVTWRGVDRFEIEDGRARRGVGYFDTHPIRLAASGAPG